MSYICSWRGQPHDGLPDLAFDKPDYAHDVPQNEWAHRVRLEEDLCIVDEEHHFIRGFIEIPIQGHSETLGIGAWVSQKPENFWTYVEHFDSSEIGPFFGWLSNDFAFGGESTLHLKTMVHFQGQGLRPRIKLEPTSHPLAKAQQEGIRLEAAWSFIHKYLDPSAP